MVWRDGETAEEIRDISDVWAASQPLTAFLIGCSLTFESRLMRSGIRLRHLTGEQTTPPPVYKTAVDTVPAGVFGGKVCVTMRPIPRERVDEAIEITARFPGLHGAPIQVGDPGAIGVDFDEPYWGEPSYIADGEVPVFWACGLTPQDAILSARLPIAITHSPGRMFVTDVDDDVYEVDPVAP